MKVDGVKNVAYTKAGNPYKKCKTGRKVLTGIGVGSAAVSTVLASRVMGGFGNLIKALGPKAALPLLGIAAWFGIGAGIDAIVNHKRGKKADKQAQQEKVNAMA